MASNGLIEIRVPDIGNYKDVEVIEVSVKAGDSVALESTLITLETEKATMDVPSTTAGTIKEVMVQRGARVSQGDVIAVVEATASAVAPAPPPPTAAGGRQRPVRSLASPAPQPAAPLRQERQRKDAGASWH
ncbi:MAG: biotin/lipoyl-binding protein [Proteobacteria bacterium]|nr:biotin/lipoyl-binding protein [Pseudomonadota bacterium]